MNLECIRADLDEYVELGKSLAKYSDYDPLGKTRITYTKPLHYALGFREARGRIHGKSPVKELEEGIISAH